jgi:hypothetical protein
VTCGVSLGPVIYVPQAIGGTSRRERVPTAAEERLLVYLSLMRGVAGVQFYCHSQVTSGGAQYSPAAWSEVRKVALEVAELAPALSLGDNLSAIINVSSSAFIPGGNHGGSGGTLFHAAWRDPHTPRGGTWATMLLLVANTDNTPMILTIQPECTLVNCSEPVTALFQQGRYLVPNSTGAVTDALLGLGTAAYRLNLLPGTGQAPMQQPLQPPQPQLNPANMVVNPSFEQAYNIGSPDGMRYDYECVGGAQTEGLQHCVDGSATAFADSRVAVHGTHSLRLTTPSSRGGVRMGPYALEAFEYSKQYTLSFWTRAEPVRPLPPSPQGLVLRLYLSNSWQTPHQLNVSVRGDGEWRQHSIDISAVSAAPKHKPLGGRNWMQYSLVSVGKVWVDLLQLVPTRAAPYHKL